MAMQSLSASAVRSATFSLTIPQSPSGRGYEDVTALINVTAKNGTPSFVATIEQYDPASATWFAVSTSAAITDVGKTRLQATNVGDELRITFTLTSTTSLTFSVGLITRQARR